MNKRNIFVGTMRNQRVYISIYTYSKYNKQINQHKNKIINQKA